MIQGIRARAPQARIFALNYAAIFPERGSLGCWPQLPVADGDIAYLREKQKELNAMIAAQAAANGAGLIDWYGASIGHDACKPPADPLGRAARARQRRRAGAPEPARA